MINRYFQFGLAFVMLMSAVGAHAEKLISTKLELSNTILDFQEGITSDISHILDAYKNNQIRKNKLYIGASVRGGFYYEQTNTAAKFPVLSRFPHQHSSGKSHHDEVIQNAAISLVGKVGNYAGLVSQIEYSEVNFAHDQERVQLREAYFLVANPEQHPFYFALGRKTIDFGEFDSFNAFTQSVNQHFFWALSDDPVAEVGYDSNNWHLSGSLIRDTRQLRTGLGDNEGEYDVYAFKIKKIIRFNSNSDLSLSLSYLSDSIYRNNFTAHTKGAIERGHRPNGSAFPPKFIQYENGLWSLSSLYKTPEFDLGLEYTVSENIWPATSFNMFTGDQYSGTRKLQAITAQGRYKTQLFGKSTTAALVFSRGIFGPNDREFDDADQHVASIAVQLNKHLNIAFEYVYNRGFQPFVGIQDASDSEVESHLGIIGLTATF